MSSMPPRPLVWLLAGLMAGSMAVASLAAGLAVLWWIIAQEDAPPSFPDGRAEAWIDYEVEAGAASFQLDPNDPLLARRCIVITTGINELSSKEVVAKLLYLAHADPARPIDLFLRTEGGWEDDAFAIVDAMRAIPCPVNVYAMGGCYSAGTLILTGATGKRFAFTNTLMMVHATADPGGDGHDYEPRGRDRYAQFFQQHAKLPRDWYPLLADTTYYLTPAEALRYGVIDAIAEGPVIPPLPPAADQIAPASVESANVR